jgi:uncharacterized protein involved in exopolysaccharide biosynthesis
MDFWQTVNIVFRRWYITFPAFLAALGVAISVYGSVPTQYVSNSVLVLTTPRTGGTEEIGVKHPNSITNPLLNFEQGLSLSASLLIQTLRSPEAAAALGVSPTSTTSYQVNNGSTNPELLESGPFIFIEGTSKTPQEAQDIVRRVAALASEDLARRQKQLKAPASTYITLNQVVPPTTPLPRTAKKLRAAGVAGTLGVLAGLAAGFAFESTASSKTLQRAMLRQRNRAVLRQLELDGDQDETLDDEELETSLRSG